MNTNVLIMGLVITALFVVPFYLAFRHGRKGKTVLHRLFTDEAGQKKIEVSKIELFGYRGFILDRQSKLLLWCESADEKLINSRVIRLGDAVDCRVLVNNHPWNGKVNYDYQVGTVKIRFVFSRGDSMQDSLTVFDVQTDDPMAGAEAVTFAAKWNTLLRTCLG